MSPRLLPRRTTLAFYVATRSNGAQVRLLLGPFTEKGVAASALDAARELVYLLEPDCGPTPAPVEVVALPVQRGSSPRPGELNGSALRLYAREH